MYQIYEFAKDKKIKIENKERLKCELKRYGLNEVYSSKRNILSKEDFQVIKNFKNNEEIVIRKADKSN